MSSQQNLKGFSALGVGARVCERLIRHNIHNPTPIQQQAIPLALEGHDLIGIAQTGTGKTLAFGIPMLARLEPGQSGLVLAPTRELAQQVAESLARIGARAVLVVGGDSMSRQVRELRARPQVIVATPGRLLDHLDHQSVNLSNVSVLVLDEADRMFDMGFAPAIRRILAAVPRKRQTLLFSATMPKSIAELAGQHLTHPRRVEIARAGTSSELVQQELMIVGHDAKRPALANLLRSNDGTVLVFARTRHGARKLAKTLRAEGHTAAELHSDRTLAQRRAALQGFKAGEYRVLVATDIAARGIDVQGISIVVNYDVPDNPEDYVHRIGRTGRAGSPGRAVTLALPDQRRSIGDIEKLIGKKIALAATEPARR